MLDVLTVLILLSVGSILASAAFFGVWVFARTSPALIWLGSGFALIGLGIALLAGRDSIADRLSIDAANALVLLGIGLCWAAARVFDGERVIARVVLAAPAIWLAACQIPAIHGSLQNRTVIASLLMALLAALIARQLWRRSDPSFAGRRALFALSALQAMVFGGRAVLAGALGMPDDIFAADGWFALTLAEPLVLIFFAVLVVVALDRQRAESELLNMATIDPLTSVLNRRGLLERSAQLIGRLRRDGQHAALLLFDLDHFKSINDRFGHLAGDRALVDFCEVAQGNLRPGDIFGRLGGEEFAAILGGAEYEQAIAAAERIREAFNRRPVVHEGRAIPATVSIGVAVLPASVASFDALMAQADRALYAAKESGRNRVSQYLPLAS